MHARQSTHLLLTLAACQASELTFAGKGPHAINFESAVVSASCVGSDPFIRSLRYIPAGNPSEHDPLVSTWNDFIAGGRVRVNLGNVRLSCVDATADQPCVAHDPADKGLFSCEYVTDLGAAAVASLSAQREADVMNVSGGAPVVLGIGAFVLCPPPDHDHISAIRPVFSTDVHVNVTVKHNGRTLPFRGASGGHSVILAELPAPPPPFIPPMPHPPPSPTPSPPKLTCKLTDLYTGTQAHSNSACGTNRPCSTCYSGFWYKGVYMKSNQRYACWWHTFNTAWMTTSTNIWSLGQHFKGLGISMGTGNANWCHKRSADPCSTSACSVSSSSYFNSGSSHAWGCCGGASSVSAMSGGFVCFVIQQNTYDECQGSNPSY